MYQDAARMLTEAVVPERNRRANVTPGRLQCGGRALERPRPAIVSVTAISAAAL